MGTVIRGEHTRLEHPDWVREDRGGSASERTGDKVVARRWAGIPEAVTLREESLEARLEEEKRGPTRGIAYEVGCQAAV